MDYTAHYPSPLGGITMASDGTALVGLWFDGQRHFASTLAPQHAEMPSAEPFAQARRWLDAYFSGRRPGFTPPLLLRGTAFRRRVWQALLAIPYGQTATYGSLAAQLGCRSAQAVAGAVGHNPVSIVIPCHRVVGADGSLTGYAAGLDRKAHLLRTEGREPHTLC